MCRYLLLFDFGGMRHSGRYFCISISSLATSFAAPSPPNHKHSWSRCKIQRKNTSVQSINSVYQFCFVSCRQREQRCQASAEKEPRDRSYSSIGHRLEPEKLHARGPHAAHTRRTGLKRVLSKLQEG